VHPACMLPTHLRPSVHGAVNDQWPSPAACIPLVPADGVARVRLPGVSQVLGVEQEQLPMVAGGLLPHLRRERGVPPAAQWSVGCGHFIKHPPLQGPSPDASEGMGLSILQLLRSRSLQLTAGAHHRSITCACCCIW